MVITAFYIYLEYFSTKKCSCYTLQDVISSHSIVLLRHSQSVTCYTCSGLFPVHSRDSMLCVSWYGSFLIIGPVSEAARSLRTRMLCLAVCNVVQRSTSPDLCMFQDLADSGNLGKYLAFLAFG